MHSTELLSLLAIAACGSAPSGAAPTTPPAPGATAAGPLTPGNHDLAISHGGRDRHYLVYLPPQAAQGAPLPVIINFHGGGGNAESHRDRVNMGPLADREGIALVFPDGVGRNGRKLHTWNSGACCGPAKDEGVDDVGFTIAVLADLAHRAPIDRTRIYATGHSNGAMMAQRLAHDAPERIAAIATVAGVNDLGDAPLSPPVPFMQIHSVDDPRALYAGGLGEPFPMTNTRVLHPPVEKVVRAWVKADGCAAEPTVGETRHGQAGTPDAAHTATRLTWSSCRGGSEVVMWKLSGSGHVWPGAPPRLPRLVGEATSVIDANEEIWGFVHRFTRPDSPAL